MLPILRRAAAATGTRTIGGLRFAHLSRRAPCPLTLRYRVTREGVLLDKASPAEDDPFAAFSEWSGAADENAYADL